MQATKVIDAWCLNQGAWRFTVIVDGCHEVADLLPRDVQAFGRPKPGDRVDVLRKRAGLYIVARNGMRGPSAERECI